MALLALASLALPVSHILDEHEAHNKSQLATPSAELEELRDPARKLAAAAYIVAPAGNACPASSTRITSKADCKAAGAALGLKGGWEGSENDKNWPKGCYHCRGVAGCSDGTWFNEHSRGSANGGATPVCIGDGSGSGSAPPSPPAVPPAPGGKILLLGDSDIEGWDSSGDTFPGSVNVGVGGYTCKDVLNAAAKQLARHTPDTVILVCGENDLDSTSVSKTFDRFKQVVETVTAAGARVIYVGTKPEPSTKKLHAEYRDYDGRIIAHAASLAAAAGSQPPPLRMVDSYNGFEDLGNPKSLYAGDKLHLSSKGYERWDEWTLQALAEEEGGCTVWRSGSCTQGAGGAPSSPAPSTPPSSSPPPPSPSPPPPRPSPPPPPPSPSPPPPKPSPPPPPPSPSPPPPKPSPPPSGTLSKTCRKLQGKTKANKNCNKLKKNKVTCEEMFQVNFKNNKYEYRLCTVPKSGSKCDAGPKMKSTTEC